VLAVGGVLASPTGAYLYDWNVLPVGQQLWLKELESYGPFPPLQDPASYNLSSILTEVKKSGSRTPSQ
jgi:arylsulfatase